MTRLTLNSIDLGTLNVFQTVARCASFAEAGRQLRLPRALVSRRVATLESGLGVRLFDRSTRKVVLSQHGRALLAQIAPHLEGLNGAIANVHSQSTRVEGTVRVSVSHAFGRSVLMPLLARFREQHPAVSLDVSLADGIVDLIDGQFDLAVRLGELPSNGLVARSLGQLPVGLYGARRLLAPLQAPAAIHQLVDLPTIALRIPGTGALYRWRFRRGDEEVDWQPPAPVLTVDSIEAVVDAVRASQGVAPIPTYLVQEDLRRRQLQRLLTKYTLPAVPVHVCFLQRRQLPARTRKLLDFLIQEVRL